MHIPKDKKLVFSINILLKNRLSIGIEEILVIDNGKVLIFYLTHVYIGISQKISVNIGDISVNIGKSSLKIGKISLNIIYFDLNQIQML